MQIDFHHAVTYVVARCAGFGHGDADTLATTAQYVDDAINSGPVDFTNDALYVRIASSNAILTTKNFKERANRMTWLPFHFLPGNNNVDGDGAQPGVAYVSRLVCLPDSVVAQRMVDHAIGKAGKVAYDLHLLGVTLHVYADTWAHQGFAGVIHRINEVEDVEEVNQQESLGEWLKEKIGDLFDDVAMPLGHARAGTLPDLPYLNWTYTNDIKNKVVRDNSASFLEAAEAMCKAMQRYQGKAPDGLPETVRAKIEKLFRELKDDKPENRHKEWLAAIARGDFQPCVPPTRVTYDMKRWKTEALGPENKEGKYDFSPGFMNSDWKKFHDAVQHHRYHVLHDLLPGFGICAA